MEKKAIYEFKEPESCWDCEMRIAISTTNSARPGGIDYECILVGDFVFHYSEWRHPDCPLKIVPETPEGGVKPCPFCGGDLNEIEKTAIAAWNRREG